MSRTALKFWAAALSIGIFVVLFAGLDNLPAAARHRIDSERTALAAAQTQAQAAKKDIDARKTADPDLYNNLAVSGQWATEFTGADRQLESAAHDVELLTAMEKQNRRQDRDRVEALLGEERGLRTGAVTQAANVQKDAAHWAGLKDRLPQTLQEMERNYAAVKAYDLAPIGAAVQKAETDWPEKQSDLDLRLKSLTGRVSDSAHYWDTSADARKQAASGNLANLSYTPLLVAADYIGRTNAELPKQADDLKALTGQLYDNWDKLLVDMETRGIGTSKEWDQKLRTVRTHLDSPTAKAGTTTSDDRWVQVPRPTYQAMEKDLGMAIEHKPAGKYDSESERVAQPAGFAYMAPPGQTNQYGYWEHRDGRDFWVFYGQYALMRDLLFGHGYRPLERGEWDSYRDYQSRGQTYYGNDGSGQRYGTAGSTTQERYSGSSYAQSGGFKDSKYASKSGSFRDSQYASPATRQGESAAPKSFGRNVSPSAPSVRSFKPAPAAPRSFKMPSAPRRFGKH